jgi:hypothetical protein
LARCVVTRSTKKVAMNAAISTTGPPPMSTAAPAPTRLQPSRRTRKGTCGFELTIVARCFLASMTSAGSSMSSAMSSEVAVSFE